jgi:hypothetical protein
VEKERRRTPRYPFTASAEVVTGSAKSGVPAQVTELSLYGCFLEMADPLEEGAKAKIKIYAEGRFFEAKATVVSSRPNQGMGVSFQNVYPHYRTVLRVWLLEAAHTKFGKRG